MGGINEWAKQVDTSLPVSAAAQGMLLSDEIWPLGGRVPIDYTAEWDTTEAVLEANIKFLKRLCTKEVS